VFGHDFTGGGLDDHHRTVVSDDGDGGPGQPAGQRISGGGKSDAGEPVDPVGHRRRTDLLA
jgi:hypothetical protein